MFAAVGLASCGFGAAAGLLVGRKSAKTQKRVEDIDSKTDMVHFLKRACSSKNTPEYKELYRFLLSVFKKADRDFDGLVGSDDFDIMVEMAGAIPRKFAFAPTSLESFATDGQRADYRKSLFSKIDADGSGGIDFSEWLNYSYQHICHMTATLDEKKADLGLTTKDRFKDFIIKACSNRRSAEYKELYDLLLTEFVAADQDMDGKVSFGEFDRMIDLAAAWPRKFGYAPPASKTYKTTDDRIAARTKMFKQMDTDGNGTITFEEWLTFAYQHICAKAVQLDQRLTGVPPAFVAGSDAMCPIGAGTAGMAGGCPYGMGR